MARKDILLLRQYFLLVHQAVPPLANSLFFPRRGDLAFDTGTFSGSETVGYGGQTTSNFFHSSICCWFCFQLSQKEQQVRAYQETANREDHKEHFTNQQLEDRLRHYEAQAQLVDTLQRELSSAQVVV